MNGSNKYVYTQALPVSEFNLKYPESQFQSSNYGAWAVLFFSFFCGGFSVLSNKDSYQDCFKSFWQREMEIKSLWCEVSSTIFITCFSTNPHEKLSSVSF